ncbi:hypothetical protein ACLUV9_01825 [Limosilactobacillus balticus]|uniref:hypothetical protein n=1 Tax=Limosilactobacillus balticus TaxID=2759747 RepID=UPI0039945669
MDFIIKNWDKVITILISAIALTFSILSFNSQRKIKKELDSQIKQGLENSAQLALFDIDLLINKVTLLKGKDLNIDQLNYQVESLKDNLNTVKNITFTQLGIKHVKNYQVYRKNLQDVIYKLEDNLKEIQRVYGNGRKITLTPEDESTLMKSLKTVRHVIQRDNEYLKQDADLLQKDFEKAIEVLDHNAGEKVKEYESGYRYVTKK